MITKELTNLLSNIEVIKEKEEKTISSGKITVNKTISKLAFFYEKIRNTLDYGDEHLVRKNTIERILKRRMIEDSTGSDISRFLINELIRGGYIEDNSLPESKIYEIAETINKYILLRNSFINLYNEKQLREVYKWSLSLMACEIEERLVSMAIENSYIEAFYKFVEKKIKLKDQKIISKKDLDMQLYVAITRLITKSDDAMLSYRLFKMYNSEWKSPSKEFIDQIASKFLKSKQVINEKLNHKIGRYLIRQLSPYAIRFRILRTSIQESEGDYNELFSNKEDFNLTIKKICSGIYKKIRGKLRRSVVRSIIYIFITKMILAFILEIPFDLYFIGHIDYIPLYINIIFPPLLLFLITMSAKVPSDKNTESVVLGIDEVVYGDDEDKIICEIKNSYERSNLLENIFKTMYFVTFIISYGGLIWLLYKLNFNIVSGGLFLLFLSLVSFFGIRIRRLAKEYIVIARKENILTFLLDIFSYPIIRVGQWVSDKSAKVNIFIFILDVIIEAPFKTLIEIFDQWTNFIKEKRDDLL